ncbi:MAG: nickel pincer cofactor biosynthesis protein LarB [Deltaproteobacteria bacterium]|nr:nickel pincer cofactor biosynthesis protein LarB [Deltaproteobacteria bacterium]MBM4299123.1 nickel pincer cofactor biosynthesis protein LarB [Deltaproteobacteria bacterium]
MDVERLQRLLEGVRQRKTSVAQALEQLRDLPYEDLGFAKIDHHRALRRGFPEVVLGQGKSAKDISAIVKAMRRRRTNVLVTRVAPEKAAAVKRAVGGLTYHTAAQALTWTGGPIRTIGKGTVLVVCAGTSDIAVGEEAVVTATMMGNKVERLYDVGVAGIHRLLENRARLDGAAVLIVVAGMEGALPSVVAGLIAKPVIAVPTSVGYGASFNGLAALLGMLNSCAAGVTVVNIDNGFGAGFAASLINRL